jgi:glycosyltransferase involved in cell wall biosynthesis
VLTVTGVLKDMIVDVGVPSERVAVTPNGIEAERFTSLPPREAEPRPIVLGFVGFVREWHGLDTLIEAIASFRDAQQVRLVVVGDGPARPGLERQATALGIADRAYFTGLAERAAIPALVAGFDIALQPKVVGYASPLKIFEYMAAGRAIVAPDQANIREILTDGQTALLFDPARHGAMLDAIARLVADPELRQRLGTAARSALRTRDYTWLGNAKRITEWARLDLEGRQDATRELRLTPDAARGLIRSEDLQHPP